MGEPGAADPMPRPDRVLGLAIERSYEVFSRNRVGTSMVVRRGDITAEDIAPLAGPVRSVPAAAIDRWLPHAVTTWGTSDDLRALLPRVFELLTAGLLVTPPEAVFSKIRQGDWGEWAIDEIRAIDDIVDALWLATIAQHPSLIGLPAARVLTAIAELGRDLQPHLDDWLLMASSTGPHAAAAREHLADLARQADNLAAADLALGTLFWTPRPTEAARLERWIGSDAVRSHAR
ncbi:MAG: hypothetical protein ACJ739_09685 [Acidimicrobiales bacterium]